ncbi:MAG: hypothetical protein M0C28_11725 [Candidatus Moduliflexus flocculans]|nr:hypothetical protein [Candidatus Moduliflexus flocculans]
MCDEAQPAAEAMVAAGMPLPAWLKSMLETHWSRRFAEGLASLQEAGAAVAYTSLLDLVDRARHLGLTLDRSAASAQFGRTLVNRLEDAAKGPDADQWQEFLALMQTGSRSGPRRAGVPAAGPDVRPAPQRRTRMGESDHGPSATLAIGRCPPCWPWQLG